MTLKLPAYTCFNKKLNTTMTLLLYTCFNKNTAMTLHMFQ